MGIKAYTHPATESDKQHKKRRVIMTITGAIIVASQIWLGIINYQNDEDRKIEDGEHKTEDVKYKKHIDSLNVALQNKTEKFIKDSVKHMDIKQNIINRTVIKSKSPSVIQINEYDGNGLELSADKSHYVYSFQCRDASAKGINLVSSFVVSNDLTNFQYGFKKTVADDLTMISDYLLTGKMYDEQLKKHKCFVMWTRGTYMNEDRTKTYPFDKMFLYNTTSNIAYALAGNTRKIVIDVINKNER
jgi:hypothetical protein